MMFAAFQRVVIELTYERYTMINGAAVREHQLMPVSKDDLRDFARYADAMVTRGEATSLVDLVNQWEAARREAEETLADIQASHADIERGRVIPVEKAFSDVREQLGLG